MPTEPLPERYEFDWEIIGLIDEYGSERAALRATCAQLKASRGDADCAAGRCCGSQTTAIEAIEPVRLERWL